MAFWQTLHISAHYGCVPVTRLEVRIWEPGTSHERVWRWENGWHGENVAVKWNTRWYSASGPYAHAGKYPITITVWDAWGRTTSVQGTMVVPLPAAPRRPLGNLPLFGAAAAGFLAAWGAYARRKRLQRAWEEARERAARAAREAARRAKAAALIAAIVRAPVKRKQAGKVVVCFSTNFAEKGFLNSTQWYNLPCPRRGAGVDERGGLENRCGLCGHRGFESHPLRQKRTGSLQIQAACAVFKTCGKSWRLRLFG